MVFCIVLQVLLAVLIATFVLFQNSGSSVTGAFTSKHSDVFAVRGTSNPLVKITWTLLFLFFLNSILLSRMNFVSGGISLLEETETSRLERVLVRDEEPSKSEKDNSEKLGEKINGTASSSQ